MSQVNQNRKIINKIASTHLGVNIGYPDKYNSSLLVAIPRLYNREGLGYNQNTILGGDIWRCHEVSCLDNNGVPFFALVSININQNTDCIVESKSLKLYLNSLAGIKMGTSVVETKAKLKALIKKDLEELLNADIEVNLFTEGDNLSSINLSSFERLEDLVSQNFTPKRAISFQKKEIEHNIQQFCSSWLKSRCRITDQPDWGNIYIEIKGANGVDYNNFASWLIYQHDLNHFHEEMCELIYTKIMKEVNPEKLTVGCFYTRRGGIDINPIRTNDEESSLLKFYNQNTFFNSTFRQ